MSAAINFSGIASGIDTSQIIQELLRVDSQPITLLQADQQSLQSKETAYNSLSAQLLTLQTSASALDNLQSFQQVTASSSNSSVATVSAQTGAQTGTHTLSVNALAQAQLVSSTAQTSQTSPLNLQGQIVINGVSVNVSSTDSLQTLAQNINSAQAGVTASIITPTSGQYYLTLGSNNTGLQGQMSLADVGSGSVLSQLGILGSTGQISHPLSSGGAGSDLFGDSATSVATLEGLASAPTGTVQIQLNGGASQSVNIDLSQSLSQIASSINSALGSSAASVVTVTDPITSSSKQQLQIAGATGFTDSNNVLADLGLYQQAIGTGRQLVAAQDASFTLDGLAATRPTNSVSDAISGVTFNLLQAATSSGSTTTPATTTISVTPDTATIQSNIQSFVTAFNSTVDMVANQSTFDSATGNTGIFFGDSTVQGIINQLTVSATSPVAGVPTSMSLLSQIGITLDSSGHLNIDQTALTKALSTNLQGVAKLFEATGKATDPNVEFVSSTAETQPSGSAGYAVQITQAASQAQATAQTAQTQALAADETLTFSGSLFGTSAGGSGPTITLHAGSSAADVVSQINGSSSIGSVVSASLDSQGTLQLTSKQFGSNAQFQVVSSAAAAANSSGIGTTALTGTGQDVAGTINGETASGKGQFLTGSQTGGSANGLQLRVTATQPGSYGSVTFTSGVADGFKNYINTQTDPFTGALTTAVNSFQTQYNDDQTQITQLQAQLAQEQTMLQQEFTAMETSVAQLKAAGAGIALLATGVLPTSTAPTTSGSTSTGTASTGSSSSGAGTTG